MIYSWSPIIDVIIVIALAGIVLPSLIWWGEKLDR